MGFKIRHNPSISENIVIKNLLLLTISTHYQWAGGKNLVPETLIKFG